jgi:hypothetical protein
LKPEDSDLLLKVILKAHDSENLDDVSEIQSSKEPFMYCMNYVKTKKEENIKRGAIVKSITVCSTNFNLFCFKPMIMETLDSILNGKENSEDLIISFFDGINLIDFSKIQIPNPMEVKKNDLTHLKSLVYKYSTIEKIPLFTTQMISFQEKKYKLQIPFEFHDYDVNEHLIQF